MLQDLVRRTRTYRRFDQAQAVSLGTLRELVDLARLSASGANLQPLKYILSADPAMNARIFPSLGWAGYLRGWDGPVEGERPAAYIVILLDTAISKTTDCDHGIAAQSIMLGATERGLGGCMIGSIKRPVLREVLDLDEQYEIKLVLALGKPAETVEIEALGADGSIKYWRDEDSVHHVPKRALDDLILSES